MIDDDEDLVEDGSIGAGVREDALSAKEPPGDDASILTRLLQLLRMEVPELEALVEGYLRNEVKCAIFFQHGGSEGSGSSRHYRVQQREPEGQHAGPLAPREADAASRGRCGATVVTRATRLAFEAARRASPPPARGRKTRRR